MSENALLKKKMNTEVSKRYAIYRLFSNGSENKYNIAYTDYVCIYIYIYIHIYI